ncbi:MAG: hypothetical protein WBB52_14745 [Acidimicrobiales bacterium]
MDSVAPVPAPRAHRVSDVIPLAAGVIFTTLVRLAVTLDARAPQVVADETAYLAMARFSAGGPAWNLADAAPYMPLYSLLIAPAELFGFGPAATFRWAVVVNVMLAGVTFVVVEALARHLAGMGRPWTAVAAALAVSMPALVLGSGLAWSDNLVLLMFPLVLVSGLRLLSEPCTGRAAAFAGTALVGYAAHARFLPVLVVVLATLAVLARNRSLRPTVVAVGAIVMVAGVVVVNVWSAWLADSLGMGSREGSELAAHISVSSLTTAIFGQVWYLTVTTAGLAFLGGLALGRWSWVAVRNSRRGDPTAGSGVRGDDVDRWGPASSRGGSAAGTTPLTVSHLALTVALIGISFATSAGYMAGRPRPDHLVYGRYNDMLLAPLVVIGFGALLSAGRRRLLGETAMSLAVTAIAAAVVWIPNQERLRQDFVPYTVLGLLALDPMATQRLRVATLVGGVTMVVLVAAAAIGSQTRRRLVPTLVAALLVVAGVWRADVGLDRYIAVDPSISADIDALLPTGQTISCVDQFGCPLLEFYRYQFYLPERRFEIVWYPDQWGDGAVMAGVSPEQTSVLRLQGYREIWRYEPGQASIWVLEDARMPG